MKKVVSLLLALVMALTLVACGDKNTGDTNNHGTTGDDAPAYRIGIVTGSVSQSEDDRRGAEAVPYTHLRQQLAQTSVLPLLGQRAAAQLFQLLIGNCTVFRLGILLGALVFYLPPRMPQPLSLIHI